MQNALSCDACGATPGNHAALWVTATMDTLALALPLHHSWPQRMLARIGDRFLTFLGRFVFSFSRLLNLISLTDDIATATTDRSRFLWAEAKRRGIPMQQVLFLGKPSDTFKVGNEFFKSLPFPSVDIDALRMDDKVWFKRAMVRAGLPVPQSHGVHDLKSAMRALEKVGVACVKPRSGSNGRHTYTYVKTEEDMREALGSVREICAFASVEEQLEGNLCRATCVNGKLLGFLESQYPAVVGDGVSTIQELIDAKNASKAEGVSDIVVSNSYLGQLKRRGYAPHSVLPEGTRLPLSYRAGAGQGGSNKEHGPAAIHPSFIPIIEKAAAVTGLSIVGFDVIIPDPFKPADSQRWGFIEANSLPWIDLHATPFSGEPNDLSVAVWDQWEASRTR